MQDRLAIASRIASGFMSGVPLDGDDIFPDDDVATAEQKKCCKAVARLSLMMADALIEEANGVPPGLPQS